MFAGQSNAVGYATDTALLTGGLASWDVTQPNVLYSGPQESPVNWQPLTPPSQSAQVASGSGFGPELSTGETISNALGGEQVAEVKFAVNGTNLYSQWNPSTPGGLYSQMVAQVQTALADLPVQQPGVTGKVAGFFWMQGESDVGRTTAQYQTDLTNFIAAVRAQFGDPNLPFIFGLINDAGPGTDLIRQAQENVAATVSNAILVDTDGYPRDTPGDDIHFNTQGTIDLGIGFGDAFLTTVVPEPSSIVALIGLCGMGLFMFVRRRKA